MYAKLENGVVVKYPYTQADLQAAYPNSTVPNTWSSQFMESQGIVTVVVTGAPEVDHTKNVDEGTPAYVEQRNRWEQTWIVSDASDEEIQARIDAQSRLVRSERNAKLAASDWTQVLDAQVDRAAWATYRQELRDITTQSGFPWEVVWPQEP